MSLSFTAEPGRPLAASAPARRKVLVTGAAGSIGSYFAEQAHERYDLRLMVIGNEQRLEQIRPFGDVITADLGNLDRLKEACRCVDTVLHLAANADPSTPWNELLQNNIVGTYNVMVAAKSAGCRRVIYASSIHAVSGYPPDVQVKTSEPVNPGDLYGVSKCFGEALGRYMAEREGLSVIALRIGAFGPPEHVAKEGGHSMLDMFVSRRDLQQMFQKCIDVENLRWAVFHAVSDNRFKRLDITDARELIGYAPEDDAAEINPQLNALRFRDNHHTASLRDNWQQSGIREQL